MLEEAEREALKSVDESLKQIQRSLEEAAPRGALDRQAIDRLAATAKKAEQRVNASLPPQLDDRAPAEIRDRLIAILTLDLDETTSLDVADRFLMEMEAVRHILRDVLDEQPPVELRDAANLVTLLESWLPRVGVAQLAEILGLSERALQRRRHGEGEATHRMGSSRDSSRSCATAGPTKAWLRGFTARLARLAGLVRSICSTTPAASEISC